MTIVPCTIQELGDAKRYSDNIGVLEKFKSTGAQCVRLEDWTHNDATSCCESIRQTIRRQRPQYNMIKVVKRGDKVFLIRIDDLV